MLKSRQIPNTWGVILMSQHCKQSTEADTERAIAAKVSDGNRYELDEAHNLARPDSPWDWPEHQ